LKPGKLALAPSNTESIVDAAINHAVDLSQHAGTSDNGLDDIRKPWPCYHDTGQVRISEGLV
jgi:hypothetical protein